VVDSRPIRVARLPDGMAGTTIQRIVLAGDRVSGIVTDRGTVSGDAYLVAIGSYSPLLLKPIGIRVPVYPVKGYSLTVVIADAAGAPESSVVDETYKVAIQPARRPRQGRRHGGARGLRPRAAAGPAADPRTPGARPGPDRRRCRQRELLVRPAADDARRSAGAWRDALPQSLA
jgi:glycine/D-amino acid oxidase-like deaminating enzyme